jgi:hypothetical protein
VPIGSTVFAAGVHVKHPASRRAERELRPLPRVGGVRVRVILLVVLVGALSACGGRPSPAPSPTPAANAGLGDRRSPAPAALQVREVEQATFQTPSKNITCDLSAAQVRCDIDRHDWAVPAKPASCQLGWGHGVYVDASAVAGFMCAGDTLSGSATLVLEYGTGLRSGDFLCDSESSAIRCDNEQTGHGFTLAVQDYNLF